MNSFCKTLAVLILPTLVSLAGHAATGVWITVEGAHQGVFKGDSTATHNQISALGFSVEMDSPIDQASGQASGKRQWKPLVITKDLSASSPQFFTAMATNEVLKTVVIQVSKQDANGAAKVMEKITLTNAVVISVRQVSAPTSTGASQNLEEISLTFQKIELQNLDAQTGFNDDWGH